MYVHVFHTVGLTRQLCDLRDAAHIDASGAAVRDIGALLRTLPAPDPDGDDGSVREPATLHASPGLGPAAGAASAGRVAGVAAAQTRASGRLADSKLGRGSSQALVADRSPEPAAKVETRETRGRGAALAWVDSVYEQPIDGISSTRGPPPPPPSAPDSTSRFAGSLVGGSFRKRGPDTHYHLLHRL